MVDDKEEECRIELFLFMSAMPGSSANTENNNTVTESAADVSFDE